MRSNKFVSRSPEETFMIGEELGKSLKGGEAVLLWGGLGAGKTLFAKGLLHALGLDADEVTSPSFALVNRYDARLPVYHIDLWRLEGSKEPAFAIGLDDILDEERAVLVIEWAGILGSYRFPGTQVRVRIEGDGECPRVIHIEGAPE